MMTEVRPVSDFNSSSAIPTQGFSPSTQSILGETDIRKIHAALIKGDDSLARRKDLGEIYKRLVSMFTTFEHGISEMQATKASEDRAALVERLNEVERSVNSMEGALRIELEPMLRGIVADIVLAKIATPKSRIIQRIVRGAVVCVAIAFGAVFSSQIIEIFTHILSQTMPNLLNRHL